MQFKRVWLTLLKKWNGFRDGYIFETSECEVKHKNPKRLNTEITA